MVQGPSPDLFSAIRSPASLDEQVASLKLLKNELVGHEQRKELVVRQGAVEPLVAILAAPSKAAGKRSANGVQLQPAGSWTLEDEARLQATLILGSLAGGGQAFVKPLLAARMGRYLLEALAAESSPRLVTATLQALRNLAKYAPAEDSESAHQIELPIETFKSLLHHSPATSDGKQQQKLAAEIIALSVPDDSKRSQIANGGLLDVLASLLVSHAIADRHIDYRGVAPRPQAPPTTTIPTIITAITAIIKSSNFRVQCFILSPSLREVFGKSSSDTTDPRLSFGQRNGFTNPTEDLLPPLHVPIYKSVSFNDGSSAFPALSSMQPIERRGDTSQYPADVDHANAVLSWLIFLARSMQGLNRLIALRLVALVNLAIDADTEMSVSRSETLHRARERERQLAMLAIPLAVSLIRTAAEERNHDLRTAAQELENQEIQEQACEVLALLILGSKELQTAAVDAGAIKHICPILKQSLDAVTVAKPMWSPRPTPIDTPDLPESCRMGPRGLPREICHVMNCRQSALEALAALAKKEDLHRKAIVEAGVVSCIIDSLRPMTPEFAAAFAAADKPPPQFTAKDGNTTAVILAACHAAQSMSRSVSLLRTSLIDAGIAQPVFDLLKHADPEIQIAATNVCCNLLLEFSPMRDDLLAVGAIKTLSEHARQSEMGLRLASLWALKHLVLASNREVKMQCVEELGIGWLVGAIQGEYRDTDSSISHSTSGGVSVSAGALSTPNAAGEQVDLLNPATSMDVDDPAEDDDEDEDGEVMYDEAADTHYQSSQLRSTLHNAPHNAFASTSAGFNPTRYLRSVRDLEQNPLLQAKKDDIAVQEQALDFIRNLLNGEDCAWTFEWLLHAIGQDKVFALLSDKLAPITSKATTNSNGNGRAVYQPSELILSTVHVMTHIANASPTHKQLLIAQKELLKNWLPHFTHPDRRVRVICVWAVNSLTWVEDDTDRAGAIRRAAELRHCGIEAAIRGLAGDVDLDVRERVKTALRQIDAL